MNVVLRTHGGLGNQIFQILFARLYAEKNNAKLYEVHDLNYPRKFARSSELGKSPEPISYFQRLLSSLRLPKVLHRIGWGETEKVLLFGTVYLDGYFQAADKYRSFDPGKIAEQLIRIREELKISRVNKRNLLVHLRLGDFFCSSDAARLHVVERLSSLPAGSILITNEESLLREPELQSMLINIGCEVQTTEKYSPEEIIRFMAQFEQIDANESTLSFWASVLGGCTVGFLNPSLIETRSLFESCLNS